MHIGMRCADVEESSGFFRDELPRRSGADGAGGKSFIGGGYRVGNDVVVLPFHRVAGVDGEGVGLVLEAADEDGVGLSGGFLTTRRRSARTPAAGKKKHHECCPANRSDGSDVHCLTPLLSAGEVSLDVLGVLEVALEQRSGAVECGLE